jgi:hypothetical protein
MFEVLCRRDSAFEPTLKSMALAGDSDAFATLLALIPVRRLELSEEVYAVGKRDSLARDRAAFELLKSGDPRGAGVLRASVAAERSFIVRTAGGSLMKDELAYFLIRYADGNNKGQIEKDLRAATVQIRYRFPDLAALEHPAIDAVLLRLVSSPRHAYRKWLAIAARGRVRSPAYRRALEKLAKDPVRDVRDAALSALSGLPGPNIQGGTRPRPVGG